MKPITVTLDKPRALRWTHRADARLGSLSRPPEFADLVHANRKRAFYALAAHVWAALVDRDAPFDDYEKVVDYIKTTEQQLAAWESLIAALVEAEIISEKKTSELDGKDSGNGLSESSNSVASARTTTTAPQPSGVRCG